MTLTGTGADTRAEAVLAALDDEQRTAARAVAGPVCILAGAGTGKTRTITRRIAHLVGEGHVRGDQVLAVTFTARADDPDTEGADGFNVQINSTQSAAGTVLQGLEMQGHIPFNWLLPDSGAGRFFGNFGIRGTLTKLFTQDTALIDPFTGKNLPLNGASDLNYSLVFYYDDGRLSSRTSYTYRSSFLSDPSSPFGGAVFDDATRQLDTNISYDITKNVSVRLQARNLLADPRKQYLADGLFPYTYTRNGRQYVIGVRAKF